MRTCVVCGAPANKQCDVCGAFYCEDHASKLLALVIDHGQYTKRACPRCVTNKNLRVIDPNHSNYMN